jgi:hypothetical protein
MRQRRLPPKSEVLPAQCRHQIGHSSRRQEYRGQSCVARPNGPGESQEERLSPATAAKDVGEWGKVVVVLTAVDALVRPPAAQRGREDVLSGARSFAADDAIPCHSFLPVLVTKPGALRNGTPFKDWAPRPPWSRCTRLKAYPDSEPPSYRVVIQWNMAACNL